MAGKVGKWYAEQVLSFGAGIVVWTPDTLLDMHLFTDLVDSEGNGTECSGNGYFPIEVTHDDTVFGFSVGKLRTVQTISTHVPSGGNWGLVKSVSFAEQGTPSHVYYYGELTQHVQSAVGQAIVIPSGGFTAEILSS